MELELLAIGELAGTAVQRRSKRSCSEMAKGPGGDRRGRSDRRAVLKIDAGSCSSSRCSRRSLPTCVWSRRSCTAACTWSGSVTKRSTSRRSSWRRRTPGSASILPDRRDGDLVVTMLRTVMEAFPKRDLSSACKLPGMDDPVDRLNRATHLEAPEARRRSSRARLGPPHELVARAAGAGRRQRRRHRGAGRVPDHRRVPRVHGRVAPASWRRDDARARGSSSSRTRSPSRTRSGTTWSARGSGWRWLPTAAGAGTIPRENHLARDPRPDAAGALGARRLPDDPCRVGRADHHGDRQGLGGGQGRRAWSWAPTTTSPSRSRFGS